MKKRKPATTKGERARLEAEKKEEEERRKAEERRKKTIKYPIEDLQLDPFTERDLEMMNAKNPDDPPRHMARPTPKANLLPVEKDVFEPLMNSYLFLQACGKALLLSPFILDDYLAALNHRTHDPACNMVSEIHAALLNVIVRDVSNAKMPMASRVTAKADEEEFDEERNAMEDEQEVDEEVEEMDELDSKASSPVSSSPPSEPDETKAERAGASLEAEAVYTAARKLGRGWEKKVLRPESFRDGWEYSLIGFLSKRANVDTFPRSLAILSHLTGVGSYADLEESKEESGARVADAYKTPVHRYPTLSLRDKIWILQFLCEHAVLTKSVKLFFDECEQFLTELRKERIELNRARKKLAEDRAAFEEEHVKEKEDVGEEVAPQQAAGKEKKQNVEVNGTSSNVQSENEGHGEEDELASDAEGESDDLSSAEEYDSEAADSTATGDLSEDRPYRRNFGSRQEAMRVRAIQKEAEEAERLKRLAQQREEQKARNLEIRQITLERKRLDEEEARIVRREEAIDREFRQHSQAPRLTPMGRDRFLDKYWWFDGVGSGSIFGAHGQVQYSTGRLFVQGASVEEWEALLDELKPNLSALEARRKKELGEEGALGHEQWAVFTEPEEVNCWWRSTVRMECSHDPFPLVIRSMH